MKRKTPMNRASAAEDRLPHVTLDRKTLDRAVEDLKVSLPNGRAPKPFKLIALVTFVGGLGIVGSLLVDIARPAPASTFLYFLRVLFGFSAIVVAYGLARKESWSVWLYGVMVFVSFLISPVFAILPAIIVAYLMTERRHLKASFPEFAFFRAMRSAKKTAARFKKRLDGKGKPRASRR